MCLVSEFLHLFEPLPIRLFVTLDRDEVSIRVVGHAVTVTTLLV